MTHGHHQGQYDQPLTELVELLFKGGTPFRGFHGHLMDSSQLGFLSR